MVGNSVMFNSNNNKLAFALRVFFVLISTDVCLVGIKSVVCSSVYQLVHSSSELSSFLVVEVFLTVVSLRGVLVLEGAWEGEALREVGADCCCKEEMVELKKSSLVLSLLVWLDEL